MENNENSLNDAYKYLIDLYEQISLLMQTSDKLLGENSWECIQGNMCFSDTSSVIMSYKKWLPREFFRFYMSTDQSNNDMICISIIMHDIANQFKNFSEPLITGIYIKNKDEIEYDKIRKKYQHWWSKFFVWGYSDKTGKVFTDYLKDDTPEEQKHYPDMEFTKVFAYPLISIKTENDLEEKIVTKVLNILNE